VEHETVTMHGKPLKLSGPLPQKGSQAPDFTAVDQELKPFQFSSLPQSNAILLLSVPSLDTAVCSRETKTFSQKIEKFGSNLHTVTVSMDLPFAQKRWCGQENVKNIRVLSDFQKRDFGQKYGVLIQDLGLLARAVFVIDGQKKIHAVHLVKEVTQEPDYQQILRELESLLAEAK
jgi:thioredoxin-dependent peroxiredoxin